MFARFFISARIACSRSSVKSGSWFPAPAPYHPECNLGNRNVNGWTNAKTEIKKTENSCISLTVGDFQNIKLANKTRILAFGSLPTWFSMGQFNCIFNSAKIIFSIINTGMITSFNGGALRSLPDARLEKNPDPRNRVHHRPLDNTRAFHAWSHFV